MDDILFISATKKEHTQWLCAVFNCIQDAGITLNKSKCQFYRSQISFCRYVIDKGGLRPDSAKTEALNNMPACKNVADVRRFLGMANQLGQYTPRLSTLSMPLRELLHKNSDRCWNTDQQKAFNSIKAELSSSFILVTSVCTDALSFCLGAVICQKQPMGE